MAGPSDEVVVQQVMDLVKTLLDAVMHDEVADGAGVLGQGSFAAIGLDLFGSDALRVPMGFAAEPQYLGMTAVQVGDGMAVAELRGRDAAEQDVSVCTLFLTAGATGWQVEDLWPVAADGDLQVEQIAEPTRLFYSGDLQLALREDAQIDAVERLLVPGLQQAGMGLHLLQRGVHLWRDYLLAARPEVHDPAAWAAGLHLAMELLDGKEPDVETISAQYQVLAETAVDRFTSIMNQLATDDDAQEPVEPPPAPSGPRLLDSTGRPIGRQGPPETSPGGIILSRG